MNHYPYLIILAFGGAKKRISLPPPPPKVEEVDLDTLIKELEAELIPQPTLTPHRKQRYERIYKQICDFITSNFEKEITQLDEIQEERWKYPDEKERKHQEHMLMRILQSHGKQKLRELLNNDLREIQLFHQWLRSWEEE